MAQGESDYHCWTAEALIREIISNFESLEGVDSVEWVRKSPYPSLDELIRLTTFSGAVFRIAITCNLDETEAETFDRNFHPR